MIYKRLMLIENVNLTQKFVSRMILSREISEAIMKWANGNGIIGFDHCVNVLQKKQQQQNHRPTKASNNTVNGTWHTYTRPPWTHHQNIKSESHILCYIFFPHLTYYKIV